MKSRGALYATYQEGYHMYDVEYHSQETYRVSLLESGACRSALHSSISHECSIRSKYTRLPSCVGSMLEKRCRRWTSIETEFA